MKKAKTIIGFINTTLHSYAITIGDIDDRRASEIILAIIGDMPADSQITKDVVEYCARHYNFKA